MGWIGRLNGQHESALRVSAAHLGRGIDCDRAAGGARDRAGPWTDRSFRPSFLRNERASLFEPSQPTAADRYWRCPWGPRERDGLAARDRPPKRSSPHGTTRRVSGCRATPCPSPSPPRSNSLPSPETCGIKRATLAASAKQMRRTPTCWGDESRRHGGRLHFHLNPLHHSAASGVPHFDRRTASGPRRGFGRTRSKHDV